MPDYVYQIYDKIFKKILTLSSTAVINLINGLFDTDYPTDSIITYNWTEFHDDDLRHILADTILTINGKHSYHMEAQMEKDEDIVFRVFDYSYSHAHRQRHAPAAGSDSAVDSALSSDSFSSSTLFFPEPKIIYLATKENIPDEYVLHLDFGKQGSFPYKISTFKYLDSTPKELTKKKMIILIPFELLKLRKELKNERTPKNLERLKDLIFNDIIGSINENFAVGNLTVGDARKLKRLTHKLYNHIYSHYEEMEELNVMTDESLMLDIDIIEKEHEKQLAERDAMLSEKDAMLSEKDSLLQRTISEKDSEIAALKAEIARLQKG